MQLVDIEADIRCGARAVLCRLVGEIRHRKRQGNRFVELGAIALASPVEPIGAVFLKIVGRRDESLVFFGSHHERFFEHIGAKRLGSRVFDAALLDSHVHKVGNVARQRKVGESLHDQQRYDERDRRLGLPEIPDYAHGPSPSSPSQPTRGRSFSQNSMIDSSASMSWTMRSAPT